jgi:hypothetical protein
LSGQDERTLSDLYPFQGEGDEQSFLFEMLNELIKTLALQLDPSPIMYRASQLATDGLAQDHIAVVLAGSSHFVRLLGHLQSANLLIVDSMIPGFCAMEKSMAQMAADIL